MTNHHYPDVLLHIDGEWRAARAQETIAIKNPATHETLAQLAHARVADLEDALQSVARGFDVWRKVSAYERCQIMRKAAGLVRERADYIARLMTLEQGKPFIEARMEVLAAGDLIEWFAEEGRRQYGRTIPARATDITQTVLLEPVGPVALFTPWNFPINQLVRKLSAALASGCSAIAKAPEETPASPAELVRAFIDAGVPKGVIQLVYGDPAEISQHLIAHPTIRKISFTGSTPVGKQLAALAGAHMKKVTMELGGHAPVIIAEDADLDSCLPLLLGSKFRNAGQVCVSPTRFYIHEKIHASFVQAFAAGVAKIKVGNGLDAETQMGPLANERRIGSLKKHVEDAVQQGAVCVTGGNILSETGNFFAPTVLDNVPLSALSMNEEPFGPVVLCNSFQTIDEVISLANRLPYGLAGYAFTRSAYTAHRLSQELEVGMLTINHLGLALPEVPFGGIKDSGYGSEGGKEALEAYVQPKFISHKILP